MRFKDLPRNYKVLAIQKEVNFEREMLKQHGKEEGITHDLNDLDMSEIRSRLVKREFEVHTDKECGLVELCYR